MLDTFYCLQINDAKYGPYEPEGPGLKSRSELMEALSEGLNDQTIGLIVVEVPTDTPRQIVTEDILRAWVADQVIEWEKEPHEILDITLGDVNLRDLAYDAQAGVLQASREWADHKRIESAPGRFV